MEKLSCEACGSSDLLKQGDFFVCQSCGVKYTSSDVKKMLGTVKIDNTDKLSNLYQIARRAKDDNNGENAAKYYDMILVEDPTSWEASFYLVYFRAMECTIAQIQSAGISVVNCIDTVLKLIRGHVNTVEEQEKAVQEVAFRCILISSMLYDAAKNHFDGIDSQIRANYIQEMVNNCYVAMNISYTLGDSIDLVFPNSDNLRSSAATAWKDGITKHNGLMRYFDNKELNKSTIMEYVGKVQKYEPSFQVPTINADARNADASGCYIATCAYGSYDCPQVWTLRRYRDYTLAETWYGRTLIYAYYAISPTIVKWFGNTRWFKRMWKCLLDGLVNRLNDFGIEDTPYSDKTW